jgi:hypothetical protein
MLAIGIDTSAECARAWLRLSVRDSAALLWLPAVEAEQLQVQPPTTGSCEITRSQATSFGEEPGCTHVLSQEDCEALAGDSQLVEPRQKLAALLDVRRSHDLRKTAGPSLSNSPR